MVEFSNQAGRNVMKSIVGSLFAALFLFVSQPASALPPPPPPTPACTAGQAPTFWNGGTNKALTWWNKVICPQGAAVCCKRPTLGTAINKVIHLQQPTTLLGACEFGAFVSYLEAIYVDQCKEIPCCDVGTQVGVAYGDTYCTLATIDGVSDPGDFMRPPTSDCGLQYQLCCDWHFDETTFYYPDGPTGASNDECRPFVSGDPYGLIHDNVREFTCTYTGE
jgi:hypothetical protein